MRTIPFALCAVLVTIVIAAGALTAGQTADLVVYLRTLSGKPPWSEVEREVKRIEGESR